MFDKLKQAFAIDVAAEPLTEEERALVARLATEIVRREVTIPALAFLEMSRPLNHLAAQSMHFFTPMVSSLIDSRSYEIFAKFLERRDSIDILSRHIEQASVERSSDSLDDNPCDDETKG